MVATKAYDEFVDFIAAGSDTLHVSQFQASQATKDRVAYLIARSKNEGLSDDERSELEHYLHFEHIMRLAKARAKKYLQDKQGK